MKTLIKHIARGFSIGMLVFIILKGIQMYSGVSVRIGEQLFVDFFYNQIYSIVLYVVNYYLVYFLIDRWGKKLFKIKNLVIGVLLSGILTGIAVFIIRFITEVGFEDYTVLEFLAVENPLTYWLTMTIAITVTIIFYIVHYNKQKQEIEVKNQKIIAGTASARFDALKNQLDPHFLFNSLNVLTSLIDENPRNAQKFTASLSKVYRYVLDQKNKDLVIVDEELAFARTYSNLLQMRFEDSVIFDIPEQALNPEAKVVPLSLQLLIENAVKHNVVSAKNPLRISIYEEAGFLVVKNNLQIKEVMKTREGVGLSNIKERYALLTDRAMKVIKTTQTFETQLPMLTRQVSSNSSYTEDYTQNPVKDSAYERAVKQVELQREFYKSLSSFCVVIPFLAFINYATIGFGFMWFLFPLFGWGLGLIFQAMKAFGWNPFMGKNWEERAIKKMMDDEN